MKCALTLPYYYYWCKCIVVQHLKVAHLFVLHSLIMSAITQANGHIQNDSMKVHPNCFWAWIWYCFKAAPIFGHLFLGHVMCHNMFYYLLPITTDLSNLSTPVHHNSTCAEDCMVYSSCLTWAAAHQNKNLAICAWPRYCELCKGVRLSIFWDAGAVSGECVNDSIACEQPSVSKIRSAVVTPHKEWIMLSCSSVSSRHAFISLPPPQSNAKPRSGFRNKNWSLMKIIHYR